MMLWTSNISGAPASSTPASARIGMRRSPNASNCSRESQTSLTRKLPSEPNATWNSSPSGGHSPEDSTRGSVSSYFSLVTLGAPVKRTTMLILGSSMVGEREDPISLARRSVAQPANGLPAPVECLREAGDGFAAPPPRRISPTLLRGSRRGTHDQLDGQHRRPCRCVGILDELDRACRGVGAELAAVLPDRRQGRVRERGRLEVVEADDGDVPSRLEAHLADGLERR